MLGSKTITIIQNRGISYLIRTWWRVHIRQRWYGLRYRRLAPSHPGTLVVGGNIDVLCDLRSRIYFGSDCSIGKGVRLESIRDGTLELDAKLIIGNKGQIKSNSLLRVKSGVIQIGNRFSLGERGEISCRNANITIGNDVRVAAEVFMTTNGHNHSDASCPMVDQGYYHKSIEIGNDVWVGRRAIILPGVRIGNGVIIGAGAVVTRDIPDYSVAVGVPARVVKCRRENDSASNNESPRVIG